MSVNEYTLNNTFSKEELKIIGLIKNTPWQDLEEEQKELMKRLSILKRKEKKEKKEKRKIESLERHKKQAPTLLEKFKDKVNRSNKLFCMDLEFYENKKLLTEIGVSIYNKENNRIDTYHFIVEEHKELRNGIYVPDHKDDFQFGKSEVLPLDEIEKKVYDLAENSSYLVGHAFGNDQQFLTQCGFFEDLEVLDTQNCTKFYFEEQRKMNVDTMTTKLGYTPTHLHNGGNDAFWTLKSLLKMTGFEND